jgi:hypothetical protein
MFFTSCNRSTENNAAMKMPMERKEDPGKKPANFLTNTTHRIAAGKKISKSISP